MERKKAVIEKFSKVQSEEDNKETKQMIVDEGELPNHLSHGWRFVACPSDGRCVVEM